MGWVFVFVLALVGCCCWDYGEEAVGFIIIYILIVGEEYYYC